MENVGIIFLGLGFGMVATANGQPTIAMFAYAGGLLHLWNHALFKGVMFLGAGTLVHATGTRDMNRMGGLLRRMPLAGVLWIGGSLAISALPPLNGLVSEWLIYISLADAGITQQGFVALAPLLLIGLLGMVGALALLTFSRLIGICLLGEARDPVAANAHEAKPAMLISMGVPLAACLTIGLFPQGALRLLSTTLSQLTGNPIETELVSAVSPLGNAAVLLLFALGAITVVFVWLRHRRPQTQSTTWGCGYQFPSPRISYTGEGYSELALRHLLPKIMRPDISGGRINGMFPAPTKLAQQAHDPVLTRILLPLFISIANRFQRLRWLQQGQLPIYLCYIFITNTILMIWCLWAGRHAGG